MTAPVQTDPYQTDQGLTPAEEAVIAALAVFLASVLAFKAVMLPTRLVLRLTALGLSAHAVRSAGRLALEPALTGRTRWGSPTIPTSSAGSPTPTSGGPAPASGGQGTSAGVPGSRGSVTPSSPLLPQPPQVFSPATPRPQSGKGASPVSMARRMAADEPTMRARYVLAAAKRLTAAAAQREFTAALRREQAYLAAHRRAGQRRAQVARDYDQAARGQMFMVWVTAGDSRVDPHCAALAGTIWHVDRPPSVIPGAVHPWCRCRAVPAQQEGNTL